MLLRNKCASEHGPVQLQCNGVSGKRKKHATHTTANFHLPDVQAVDAETEKAMLAYYYNKQQEQQVMASCSEVQDLSSDCACICLNLKPEGLSEVCVCIQDFA